MNTVNQTNRTITVDDATLTYLGTQDVLHKAETQGEVVGRIAYVKIEQNEGVRFEEHHFIYTYGPYGNHGLSRIRTYDIYEEGVPPEFLS